MYKISINFDEIKVPNHFKDIHNQKCINYYTQDDEGFLIVTDTQGILHYYRKDCIVAFHIEYLDSVEEVHDLEVKHEK